MKFSYKKIFGGTTAPAEVEPPIKCPRCCFPCTPICPDWPDCNFDLQCECGQQTIPNQNTACVCCTEETSIWACTQTCAYNCTNWNPQACPDCNNYECVEVSSGSICTTCEFSPPPEPPVGGPIGSPTSCEIIGGDGGPYTNRIDLRGQYGGFTGFPSRRANSNTYGCGFSNCGSFYGDCDPDYARPYVKRYFKSPEKPGVLGITGFGIDYACLSWKSDKPARVMVLSGRNVYRYSGYLAGDTGSNFDASTQPSYGCTGGNYIRKHYPWITTGGLTTFCSDTSLNPIGVSGISEMEGRLGREFPLSDRISGLPLWGQPTATSVGIINDHQIYCGSTAACVGCECLTGATLANGIGHYGVGLTSQKPYNPQAYISEGIGAAAVDYLDEIIQPIWKGVPSCSVWAFANAVYDRIAYLAIRSGVASPPASGLWRNALVSDPGLSSEYLTVKNFIDRHHEMFTQYPHTTYSDPKDPGYVLKNYLSVFSREWASTVNGISDYPGYWKFYVIAPNVFLYDKTAYDAATTPEDAWKHVYIIGNANVLFDSGCTYPDGLTNNFEDATNEPLSDNFDSSTDIFSTDNVRHHILRLDEVNHALNNGRPGLTANSARLAVFPSCDASYGGTAQFEVSISPISPLVIHENCTVDSCGTYHIESNNSNTLGINTFACACSVCARIGDGTNRYPGYTDDLIYTTLGGGIPSCYLDRSNWRRNPSESLYFPHPRLIFGSDVSAGDCRYYGPRRLNWYIPF